jgi:8-oxo-dGTP pyrophosphatase MutT (NUDIX family)
VQLCDVAEDHAAIVLLVHPNGRRILAISRDHDTTDWGLPGGGAEPTVDCTIEDTARRELREETGVEAGILVPFHRERSGTHCTTTFWAQTVKRWPKVLRSRPFEGYVAWVSPQVLLAPTSRYREHTEYVLDLARRRQGDFRT